MNRSEQINELATALAKAQGQMAGAKKDSDNPFFKSKYADLASVVDAIRGPFAENGLAYVQAPMPTEGERVEVETVLMHASGQWVSSTVEVPVMKQDAQGYGSALTYARRYGLQAIAGVAAEDDDGNAAAKATPRPFVNDMLPTQKASPGPDLFTRARPQKEAPAAVRAPEPEPAAAQAVQAGGKPVSPPSTVDPVPAPPESPPVPSAELHTFEIAGAEYRTRGLTRDQALLSLGLWRDVDKHLGKHTARTLLLKRFGVQSRTELTEAQGQVHIEELYDVMPELRPK